MSNRSKTKLKLALLVSSMWLGVSHADIGSGLQAYYSFDDCTAKDSSGFALHGTLAGAPSCVAGRSGKALSFNSSGKQGDYVVLPTIGKVFKSGFSVCAWAQFTKGRYWERIVDLGNGANIDNLVLARRDTGNNLEFFATYNDTWITDIYATNVIKNGSWKFYCATQDVPTSVALIYVDGKLVASAINSTIANVVRNSNFIAHSNYPYSSYGDKDFMGLMDEVRIYNRPLTVAEIQALYYLGVPVSGTVKSLAKHTVTCTNNTTTESIALRASNASSFDCEAAGLAISPGDDVTITVNGPAR